APAPSNNLRAPRGSEVCYKGFLVFVIELVVDMKLGGVYMVAIVLVPDLQPKKPVVVAAGQRWLQEEEVMAGCVYHLWLKARLRRWWSEDVEGKQMRRLRLMNHLWTDPLNMTHVKESAEIAAEVVGF
nr:kinesin-like protein NACK2 [Tanacetum cinerariifolium]